MINLTKDNIDKAIINKAYDMVRKSQVGYLYTDETICTFNSMLIFRDLFNNKCRILDEAFEKLYYIADKIIQCVRPTPEDELYTVTVITNPSEATATINGVVTKQRNLASGTKVDIVAKLDGYYDKTYTIESLMRNETVEIEFTEDDRLPRYFDIKVITVPSNAVCKINGTITKTANLLEGTVCNIEVSADGYISQQTSFVVSNDRTITISLAKIPDNNIVITVNPTPSDAVVTIDGVTGNVREVAIGRHTIKVTKTGFNTYTYTNYFDRDTTLTPRLEITLNVTAYPSGCTVYIDNVQRTSAVVYPGDHRIVVSKPGYTTYDVTKNYQVSTNEQITLEQEIQYCRLTVIATPTPNTITLDGETISSKVVQAGTTVNVVVTKPGYITYINNVTVNEDTTLNVTLKNTQTFNLVSYKSDRLLDGDSREGVVITYTIEDDATVYNFVNDSTIELPINKDIIFTCGADGYSTEIRRFNFAGNYLEEAAAVPLYPESEPATEFTLTVNTIPADATVTIDGETTKQKVVSAGEHTIVASKTGYTTVTRTITVASNTTITITLEPVVSTVNLSVIATPNDAIITIDNDVVSSKDVIPGTSHTVIVSKTGYATYNTVVTVNEDMTLEVTLKNTKTVIFDAYKSDKQAPENREDVTIRVSWDNDTYVYEDDVPLTLEVPGNTQISIVASAEGYDTKTVTRTFTVSYETETVTIPLDPSQVVPKIRIEAETGGSSNDVVVTMNGIQQKVGYFDRGESVTIVCTRTGYTPSIYYLTAVQDIVIPVTNGIYDNVTNPDKVILTIRAFKQELLGPISRARFEVDDTVMVDAGTEYITDMGTHKIDANISFYNPESLTYYYQTNADIHFYLTDEDI